MLLQYIYIYIIITKDNTLACAHELFVFPFNSSFSICTIVLYQYDQIFIYLIFTSQTMQ